MSGSPRPYRSALREEQAKATRERILAATIELMQAEEDASMDAIARAAGVERRTVFRHFETREALLAEAFQWLNDRLGVTIAPGDPAALAQAIREGFARMDSLEGAVRAGLHSRAGRDMRLSQLPRRRAAFSASLAPVTANLSPAEKARIEALAHLLYSAAAWEVLKDYGGLTGAEAGQTAAWALERLLSAAASPASDAD
ncbi:TetR/AcrR family transcriptional regulator [Tabrizicola flagellatus]|jgi:AcrR family transcriptional regulator|uniref:TetR/AcrR family transcriptional regulator n=1 Tax=Tabrizicola flagellatus TaxID=2593021 RepID=UPI0011F36DA6|nr:helix-turn-helix domain-containing protein [Tabrizicola flagellatus]